MKGAQNQVSLFDRLIRNSKNIHIKRAATQENFLLDFDGKMEKFHLDLDGVNSNQNDAAMVPVLVSKDNCLYREKMQNIFTTGNCFLFSLHTIRSDIRQVLFCITAKIC